MWCPLNTKLSRICEIDLYEELASLVEQIPEGMLTTYGDLARALGDALAAKAVAGMLASDDFETSLKRRVVKSSEIENCQAPVFRDFKSDKPLLKLRQEQELIKQRVEIKDGFDRIEKIGGVDVGYSGRMAYGAFVLYDLASQEVIFEKVEKLESRFPYIPTYLGYRELPVLLKVLKGVECDVLLVDGNGILHPRSLGIASHIGVLMGMPTIGIAKKKLCGDVPGKGKALKITHLGMHVGYAYYSSKRAKKPIYISPGHRVSVESSFEIVEPLCKYKLPEPVGRAHALAKAAKE